MKTILTTLLVLAATTGPAIAAKREVKIERDGVVWRATDLRTAARTERICLLGAARVELRSKGKAPVLICHADLGDFDGKDVVKTIIIASTM